ncbi:MAG: XRE family transcriptional regulator [Candidatus Cloacimonetes bacterium]|nr:XRE family transcriptional regulator [Candidatus Cloacimonadota bacterium]
MEVPERIKTLISMNMLTQKKFAESIGISPARLNNYLAGLSKVPQDISIKIADKYNCSLAWLLTGEGEMFNKERTREGKSPMIRLPVVGDIAAGAPMEIVPDEDPRYIEVSFKLLRYPPPYLVFNIAGESMRPFLEPGDVVVCSQDWRNVDIDGKIMAFRTPDGITVKTLREDYPHKTTWLMPINNQYAPKPYCEDDEEIVMIGILDLVIREINRS